MKTKEKTLLRFLSSSDNYDPDKLEYDKQKLGFLWKPLRVRYDKNEENLVPTNFKIIEEKKDLTEEITNQLVDAINEVRKSYVEA